MFIFEFVHISIWLKFRPESVGALGRLNVCQEAVVANRLNVTVYATKK